MFRKSDMAKLEFCMMLMEDMDTIIKRHNGIDNALDDVEGYHALLMCAMQIGESLNKIKGDEIRGRLPVEGVYGLRNVIAHNYDGIDLNKIKDSFKNYLPALKDSIKKLISDF